METSSATYPDVRELLLAYDLRPKKSLGQNFLCRPELCREMSFLFPLDKHSVVLEIGPGLGNLSYELLSRGVDLSCIELDRRFEEVLKRELPQEKLRLIFADARAIHFADLLDSNKKAYLFGNLPYYLSTELFNKALVEVPYASGFCFLLQKETALRLTADPGGKAYGPSAVLAAVYGSKKISKSLGPGCFYPQPEVDSVVLSLYPHAQQRLKSSSWSSFERFLKLAFAQRRKTLKNTLKSLPLELLDAAEQKFLSQRAENLSPEEYLCLFSKLRPEAALYS